MKKRSLTPHPWRFDACPGPDWRWQRAQSLLRDGRSPTRHDDAPTARLVRLLASTGRRPRSVTREDADAIAAATELRNGPPDPRSEIEALLLAGEADGFIAARVGIPAAVVGLFASLFFDVRDRLEARDWIAIRALPDRPSRSRSGRPSDGRVMREFAYRGGVEGLDLALAVLRDGPLPDPVRASLVQEHKSAERRLRFRIGMVVGMLRTRTCREVSAVVRELARELRENPARAWGPEYSLLRTLESRGKFFRILARREAGPRDVRLEDLVPPLPEEDAVADPVAECRRAAAECLAKGLLAEGEAACPTEQNLGKTLSNPKAGSAELTGDGNRADAAGSGCDLLRELEEAEKVLLNAA